MNDAFLGDKVFQIEWLEVGHVLGLTVQQLSGGEEGHSLGRYAEGVVVAGIGVSAEDIASFSGSIADKDNLSPIQPLVERARFDHIGLRFPFHFQVATCDQHGVAFHAACIDHGANQALVVGVLTTKESRHAEQRGNGEQWALKGVAETFGGAHADAQSGVATGS